jgi:hypothetical protein
VTRETRLQKYEHLESKVRDLRGKGWKLKHLCRELEIPYEHLRYLLRIWNVHPAHTKGYANGGIMNGVYVNLDDDTHFLLKNRAELCRVPISRLASDIIRGYLKELKL